MVLSTSVHISEIHGKNKNDFDKLLVEFEYLALGEKGKLPSNRSNARKLRIDPHNDKLRKNISYNDGPSDDNSDPRSAKTIVQGGMYVPLPKSKLPYKQA